MDISPQRFEYLLELSAEKLAFGPEWRWVCTDDDGVAFSESTVQQLFVRVLAHRYVLVKKRAEYKCENCFQHGAIQIHHRVHRSQGGKHTISNLISLCSACHSNSHHMSGMLKKLKYPELTMSAQERVDLLPDVSEPSRQRGAVVQPTRRVLGAEIK